MRYDCSIGGQDLTVYGSRGPRGAATEAARRFASDQRNYIDTTCEVIVRWSPGVGAVIARTKVYQVAIRIHARITREGS